ncbi:MAG: hypothetical protein ACRDUA_06595, partial [Micromonosporaceae bacterium]
MSEYDTNVDIDGDGEWDEVEITENADGSVTLEGDVDGDGQTDFVGTDENADGLVDYADYDTDGDGQLDTRMTDVDGDGWLDTTEPIEDDAEPSGTEGSGGEGGA